MKIEGKFAALSIIILLAVVVCGCSGDRTAGPTNDPSALKNSNGADAQLTLGDPVQFAARVKTTDCNQRMLTFYGTSDTVVAAQDCEIVRLQNPFDDIPIPFSDIQVNDSLQVCGFRYEYNFILAHRLRIFADSNCVSYDLAFRDTITAIDYAAESFTVANRTETITIDANTLIWGVLSHIKPGDPDAQGSLTEGGDSPLKRFAGTNSHTVSVDTVYEFTDLQIGDIVEVRANIVDESTLLAVMIKIANCDDKKCVEFNAFISMIDPVARIVTFTDLDWIGKVCPNAALIGLDGEPITLDDFSVGDYAEVKGFPLDSDTLRICRMEMLEYR